MKKWLPVLLLLGSLAACGSKDDPTVGGSVDAGSGAAAHNDADVEFAQGMIPHHEQAVEMADLVLEAGSNPEVKALAQRIKDAQAPEIGTMKGWLEEWREPLSAGKLGGGHDKASGMMSADEMEDLGGLSGDGLDRAFLESMIRHHEGAVAMAETEVADGQFPEAKSLAQRIIETQQPEIEEMRGLLGSDG